MFFVIKSVNKCKRQLLRTVIYDNLMLQLETKRVAGIQMLVQDLSSPLD